jgi:two-component system, OmpR family, phosphate regulon sensor histidine kinase PhoR
MSELSRGETAWRRGYVVAALAAVLVLALVAAADMPGVLVASIAAAFIFGAGLYLAAPKHDHAHHVPRSAAAPASGAFPDSARDVMQYLDDPLLLLDPGGRIVFANRAAEPLVGADAERKHISAVLRTPELLEAVERVLAGASAETVTFSILVPLERHFRASVVRTAGSGDVGRILIQIHDLTAVRRAEELRADFVANASHELRTPLAAVTGFIDTLRGHARNDGEVRDRFLEIMSVEAARMRRLIDDLLSLTRIELNEHNAPADVVDVVTLVAGAVQALAPLAQRDNITVEISPQGPLMVVGERDELTQVFQNLVHNAIKYGRENGTVRVTFGRVASESRRERGQIFVAVADEGEGIPREAIPRLTERFYRVDIKRSRERGGTGLGLAIVKHIVNRHQGRLQIESTPGTGSTFTVFLPAAAVNA